MSKRRTQQRDFVKWFGPVLDALRALGGFAARKKLQNGLLRLGKLSAASASSIIKIKTGHSNGCIKNSN